MEEEFNESNLEYINLENFSEPDLKYIQELNSSFLVSNFWFLMKATRKNLVKAWILKTKLLNLLEFWDEIGFFARENWQRVQNMWHEFTKSELEKAYDDYVNDTSCINVRELKEIMEGTFLLRWPYRLDYNRKSITVYFLERNSFEDRVVRIKDGKSLVRHEYEWSEVNLEDKEKIPWTL